MNSKHEQAVADAIKQLGVQAVIAQLAQAVRMEARDCEDDATADKLDDVVSTLVSALKQYDAIPEE